MDAIADAHTVDMVMVDGTSIRAHHAATTNTPLQTPHWVPQAVWLTGMVFFALTACLASVHAIILRRTDRGSVERCYGSPTVDEEVRQYIQPEGENARD